MLGQGYDTARGDINTQYGTARGDISGGYGAAAENLRDGYGQAVGAWQPFHDQSMAGYGMYQNALGLGGEAGTAAAQGAFKEGPGYQWNVDQATGQAARAANRYGGLYSGNTNEAMGRLASNLANQEYGNWVKNLQGFQGAAQTSTGALADIYGQQGAGLAELSTNQGRDLSQVAMEQGNQLSGLSERGGIAQAGSAHRLRHRTEPTCAPATAPRWPTPRAAITAVRSPTTTSMYGTIIPSMQQGMMAGQQAAGNRFGALMGGLQLGSQILGGGMGQGGFFTNMLSEAERMAINVPIFGGPNNPTFQPIRPNTTDWGPPDMSQQIQGAIASLLQAVPGSRAGADQQDLGPRFARRMNGIDSQAAAGGGSGPARPDLRFVRHRHAGRWSGKARRDWPPGTDAGRDRLNRDHDPPDGGEVRH